MRALFNVIPAIDIREGRAVRLYQGDFSKAEVMCEDPVSLAAKFVHAGATMIHLVDLDGAQHGESGNREVIEAIVKRFPGKVQLGGGLRSMAQVENMLRLGVERVVLGTMAVEDEQLFRIVCEAYPNRVGLGLDMRNGRVCTRGWEQDTGESPNRILRLAEASGAAFVVYTDISKDGTMLGPNLTGLKEVLASTHLPVIASGGIAAESDIESLRHLARVHGNLKGVIVGKAIYKGKVSIVGSSLCRRIIPCLDVDQGRVVKGINFGNLRSVGDPVELARSYEAQGADEIVVLDISATTQGRGTTLELVRMVAQNLSIPLTVGGGVRTCDDARSLLRAGADKVAVNTAFYRTPTLITELAQEFGSQCVVAAVDVKRQGDGWVVVVSAGKEVTGLNAIAWMQELEARGAGEVLLTSIDCDGVTGGYDLELLTATAQALTIPVIASGGAGTVQDMAQAFLAGADACLAASMFHYGVHAVSSVKEQLRAQGVAIR